MATHSWILVAALAAGCSATEASRSITLAFEGKEVASCDSAKVTKLGGGGFRFHCHADVYVTYDSTEAKDGTINRVEFVTEDGTHEQWRPAGYRKPGEYECDAARAVETRKSGDRPFPLRGGFPAPGTYGLVLANPCGTATITIGEAKK